MRILIADDHAVARKGVRQILLEEYPFCEIEECSNAEEMIHKIMNNEWDIIISDISMPGRSGMDALRQIHASFPELPVLILSMYPEEQYALRAFKAGASGYFTKDLANDELIIAIKKVLSGKKYITPTLAEVLIGQLGKEEPTVLPHEHLTDREFDVFKLLASGQSISKIADMLSLSTATISTYRSRILKKMNLLTNADLTRYALEKKLI
jgi:DNA-binding NarL/FixJ family response regulator